MIHPLGNIQYKCCLHDNRVTEAHDPFLLVSSHPNENHTALAPRARRSHFHYTATTQLWCSAWSALVSHRHGGTSLICTVTSSYFLIIVPVCWYMRLVCATIALAVPEKLWVKLQTPSITQTIFGCFFNYIYAYFVIYLCKKNKIP